MISDLSTNMENAQGSGHEDKSIASYFHTRSDHVHYLVVQNFHSRKHESDIFTIIIVSSKYFLGGEERKEEKTHLPYSNNTGWGKSRVTVVNMRNKVYFFIIIY